MVVTHPKHLNDNLDIYKKDLALISPLSQQLEMNKINPKIHAENHCRKASMNKNDEKEEPLHAKNSNSMVEND